MISPAEKIYCVRATNLTTQRVEVCQARYTLQQVLIIVETANQTEDAWFYEVAVCDPSETG